MTSYRIISGRIACFLFELHRMFSLLFVSDFPRLPNFKRLGGDSFFLLYPYFPRRFPLFRYFQVVCPSSNSPTYSMTPLKRRSVRASSWPRFPVGRRDETVTTSKVPHTSLSQRLVSLHSRDNKFRLTLEYTLHKEGSSFSNSKENPSTSTVDQCRMLA